MSSSTTQADEQEPLSRAFIVTAAIFVALVAYIILAAFIFGWGPAVWIGVIALILTGVCLLGWMPGP